MSGQGELLSVYQDILRNLTVNWQRQFSPTINFGYNVQDVNVEQHVLNEVGSYGMQLNRVLDLLMVLLPRVIDAAARGSLGAAERRAVEDFEDLARRADTAAASYQGKNPRSITRSDVDRMIEGMRALESGDPVLHRDLLRLLSDRLIAPSRLPASKTTGENPP